MRGRIQDDPDRRCLKVNEWREHDQELWHAAFRQGGLFDDDGAAAHWSPATREKNRKGYGRWLGWLWSEGELDPDQPPGARATRDRVRRYAAMLESSVAPYTRLGRLRELLAVLTILSPDENWDWLRQAIVAIDRSRPKRQTMATKLPSSRRMLDVAVRELRRIDAGSETPTVDTASAYRDALMIALLTARPLRRTNMAAIQIGTHLIPVGEGYKLVFEADEMKNRRAYETGLPDRLTPFIARYIEVWRLLLVTKQDTDRLWMSSRAQPMSPMAVYHRVRATTQRLFRTPMNPHLFRHAMATEVTIERPDQAAIIKDLNGHRSARTAERHYVQAGSKEVGKRYQAMIAARRRNAPQDPAPRRARP